MADKLQESVYLRSARDHVVYFSDRSEELKEHDESLERWDCEAWLQLGIEAFSWIHAADRSLNEAHSAGRRQLAPDTDEAIGRLYSAWLEHCDDTEKRAQSQLDQGFEVGNLAKFRQCREEAEEIVQRRDWLRRGKQARDSRFAEEFS